MSDLTNGQLFNLVSGNEITGESTYDIWRSLEGNENKTQAEFIQYMQLGASGLEIDSELSTTSTNPVQNKVVTQKFNELSEEIVDLNDDVANKLSKNLGASNVGKILVVGTDGNIALTDMPEGGASGDVIGTLDTSNNILLSGNLADGTYVLKYENTDGTFTEIGNLTVGKVGITNLADSTDAKWVQNGRVGSDGTDRTDAAGKDLTNFIPVTNGDVVRVKNFDIQSGFASGLYNASKGIVKSQAIPLMTDYLKNIDLTGTVETFTINHADVKFVRLCGISSLTDADVIITVNEEIV